MRIIFPPLKDVAIGCISSGLYVCSYFVSVDSVADVVVVFKVADVNPLLLRSGRSAPSFDSASIVSHHKHKTDYFVLSQLTPTV